MRSKNGDLKILNMHLDFPRSCMFITVLPCPQLLLSSKVSCDGFAVLFRGTRWKSIGPMLRCDMAIPEANFFAQPPWFWRPVACLDCPCLVWNSSHPPPSPPPMESLVTFLIDGGGGPGAGNRRRLDDFPREVAVGFSNTLGGWAYMPRRPTAC